MDPVYAPVPGVLMEPLGEAWCAFSPLSVQTHLINDTSVAILEHLQAAGHATVADLCALLAEETGQPATEAAAMVAGALNTFVLAGLARCLPA